MAGAYSIHIFVRDEKYILSLHGNPEVDSPLDTIKDFIERNWESGLV